MIQFLSLDRLFQYTVWLCAGVLFLAAAGCSLLDPPASPERPERAQGDKPAAKTPASRPARTRASVSAESASKAESIFEEARGLWKDGGASGSLGQTCSDPAKAISLLDRAIKLNPEYGQAFVWRGLAQSELGEAEKAFEDISAGIRISPDAEAYAHRGLVLLKSEQLKAARRDIDYSLQLDPSRHLAYNYLGVLELSDNNTMAACKAFREGCAKGDCSFQKYARKEKICP